MGTIATNILTFVLGLAFTLFGMNQMCSGLERLSGGRLETVLSKATDTKSKHPIVGRIKGMLVGCGVTALVQSSSSTTVMTVGFVNSGIMRLEQAIGIIMGANIGTTVTTWLFALTGVSADAWYVQIFTPKVFAPVLALVGIVLLIFSKRQRRRDAGSTLVSFGVLMYGMSMMSGVCATLADVPLVTEVFSTLENPILGVLAGALFTGIIQASAAALGIVQALAASGSITYAAAIPIILGTNIGTCVTALLSCVGASKNAKRTAMVHLYFNIIGSVLFLGLFYGLNAIFDFAFMKLPLNAADIALVHTIFNVSATIVLLPMGGLLAKLARLTIRDKPGDRDVPTSLLDDRFLNTPGYAVEQCVTVAGKMATLTRETLLLSLQLLDAYDETVAAKVADGEEHADRYEDKLGTYLVKISGKQLEERDSKRTNQLLHVISDFERISDHAVNLSESAAEMRDKGLRFSDAAMEELNVLRTALTDIVNLSFDAYHHDDVERARLVEPLEDVIDALTQELRSRHLRRLQRGECTIQLGFVYNDILTNIERVSDHCSNIAIDLIEASQALFNTHSYILDLKAEPSGAFVKQRSVYLERYALPPVTD